MNYQKNIFLFDQKVSLKIPKSNYQYLQNNNLIYRNKKIIFMYREQYECNLNTKKYIPNNFSLIYANYNKNQINIIPLLCGDFFIKDIVICDIKSHEKILLKEEKYQYLILKNLILKKIFRKNF